MCFYSPVTLETVNNTDFEGFMLQARPASHNSAVGRFMAGNASLVRLHNCFNTEVVYRFYIPSAHRVTSVYNLRSFLYIHRIYSHSYILSRVVNVHLFRFASYFYTKSVS